MAVITVARINNQSDVFIEGNSRRRVTVEACCIPRGNFVSKGVESVFALRLRGQKALCSIWLFPGEWSQPILWFRSPRRELLVQSIRTHQPRGHPWFLSHSQALAASKQELPGSCVPSRPGLPSAVWGEGGKHQEAPCDRPGDSWLTSRPCLSPSSVIRLAQVLRPQVSCFSVQCSVYRF